ncbi:MAG: hypothetical protein WKF71_20090 [Pyrinomonadaceae bacterium]
MSNPNALTRTIVSEDFRAPASDQFSFEVQRELPLDSILKIGYVGTKGTGLFQTVDGNPRGTVCQRGGVTVVCNALNRRPDPTPTDPTRTVADPILAPRINPALGIIRLRTNCSLFYLPRFTG